MIFLKKIIAVVKPLSVTDAFPTFFLRKNIGIKSPVDFWSERTAHLRGRGEVEYWCEENESLPFLS